MESIIDRTSRILHEKGMTYYQLCQNIGIPHNTYATWKQRQTNPPSHLIKPISDFLGVSTDYLLTGGEDFGTKLTQSESELLIEFNQLTPTAKKHLLKYAELLLEKNKEMIIG